LIHESSTEVSRPPEYARTIFIAGNLTAKPAGTQRVKCRLPPPGTDFFHAGIFPD
jgi:hypothetical protein